MVNRAALILKVKKPFVQWINETDPHDSRPAITMTEANEDRTVYLIDSQEAEELEDWIALNCANLFESELEDWHTDETLWPQNRDLKLFHEWFAVECHTVLVDTGSEPMGDDEE